jgi:hypothetical protein
MVITCVRNIQANPRTLEKADFQRLPERLPASFPAPFEVRKGPKIGSFRDSAIIFTKITQFFPSSLVGNPVIFVTNLGSITVVMVENGSQWLTGCHILTRCLGQIARRRGLTILLGH